jgi:glycosyltransferase involved in cell wall biosynthesis
MSGTRDSRAYGGQARVRPQPRTVVLLGMMAKMPVPGVVWQTVHYLLGFKALGFEPLYVEAHGRAPSMLMRGPDDDAGVQAAAFIDRVMRRFDLGDRWAYHALHDADQPCHGLGELALRRAYREAELIVNLHGGTPPLPEHSASGRLVYLQTDPVQLQVELHEGRQASIDFLEPHCAFFTFAENLGRRGCGLPVSERFPFRPTRQPVVCDLWDGLDAPALDAYTTVGNWHQAWREVRIGGRELGWSKDREWTRFLDLPRRTGAAFELALSSYEPRHRAQLEARGWRVRDALSFDPHADDYRRFIAGSRGEFTVAKEQNVELRSGWFSDRSATYLAAGRPVITQDTGFGDVLPTGKGLFPVTTLDEAVAAVASIEADHARHSRAARELARERFEAARVLGDLLGALGVATRPAGRTDTTTTTTTTDTKDARDRTMTASEKGAGDQDRTSERRTERRKLTQESRVLALIPHYQCEEWLDDALASLGEQTRPLDGIVVIDDASDAPPLEIVARHPRVTLLHAERNVGPYRLVQQVIEETDYDAYLFQDADDWSAPERLERLLAAGERTGAELIGTQEIRVFCEEPEVAPIAWPLDVEREFGAKPTAFPLLHPTSIVTRDLLVELGGFASGLRFSGDAELLRRARFVAKVANVADHGYYRRIRENSLTTASATGLRSPVRQQVMELLWEQARRNAARAAAGEAPDLAPIRTAPPVRLRQLAGPALSGRPVDGFANAPSERPAPPPRPERRGGPPRPVFVIGAPRSGVSALAWALGQHPAIPAAIDTAWMGELARELPAIHARTQPDGFGSERFSRVFGRAAASLIGDKLERWVDGAPEHTTDVAVLARLFPDARFIHVVRESDAVVRSLADPPLGSAGATGGTQIPAHLKTRLSEGEAADRWLAGARAGLEAERTLGAKRVLRVTFDELIADPEALVRRCLAFVEEEWDARCMRPLRGLAVGAVAAPGSLSGGHADPLRAAAPASASGSGTDPLRTAARALSDELLGRRAAAAAEGGSGATGAAAGEAVRAGAPGAGSVSAARTRALPPKPGSGPRIVLVTDHFPKFSETFFAHEFTGLLERGWDIHVLCNRSNRDQHPYFPQLRRQLETRERIHVVQDFDAQLAQLQPDLVHFGYGTLALGRMHMRDILGCKVVVSLRGYDINYHGLEDAHVYDDVWAHADMVNCVSQDIWTRAQRRGCPPDKPHMVITDAADLTRFAAPRRTSEDVGGAARPLRLLSVGRLHWKKGHEFGLQAVRALLDAGVAVEYRILGDGPHRESILFAIHDLGLERHVELPGARRADDVRDAMRWADVCLHPAISEGFCVSVIEAQAMGLPVVCTDADGLAENVADGVTGFVVGRRDARALSERLAQLGADPRLRARMGAAATRRAHERFGFARQIGELEALYHAALALPAPVPAGERHDAPALIDTLERQLNALEVQRSALERQLRGRRVAQGVRAFVAEALPAGATVLVVSRGDDELLALDGRVGWHFPQAEDGVYAGHHPEGSDVAIHHLEELRERGATHLVIPATSSWWLEHYADFGRHLEERYVALACDPETCVAFELRERPAVRRPAARRSLTRRRGKARVAA